MRILSVSAQKPHSTGSGVYLSQLVHSFAAAGHEQEAQHDEHGRDAHDYEVETREGAVGLVLTNDALLCLCRTLDLF